ncbi:MAG: glycosyltransferase family 39 protein [Myxococcota bacterium]|nr:glycosyltransferase family 39 protein [Myxococcota bacterium]
MVSHAVQLANGQPIYAAPSSQFVPFFYTPGYPAVLAGVSWFVGEPSLFLGRLISIMATFWTMGLLFWLVRRESSAVYGLLAVGVYASLFRTNGAFYDVARPDSLYIALVLSGCALVYVAHSWKWMIGAALVFVAAFLTKQTSSVFVPPLILYLLWRDWRQALLFGSVTFGVSSLAVWWINQATDGWFWTYIFEGHQGHLFYWKNILLEYWRDVLFLAPLLLILPLLWFGYRVPVIGLTLLLAAHWTYAFIFRAQTLDYVPHMYYRELWYESPRWAILIPPAALAVCCFAYRIKNRVLTDIKTPGFFLLMFIAGAGASALNHSTQWAYSNCFMPLTLFASCLIPLALRDLYESGESRNASFTVPVHLAVIIQMIALLYNPIAQIPAPHEYEAANQLKHTLRATEGPVFIPGHPMLAYKLNGEMHLHQMGITDVNFMGGVKDLRTRLASGYWNTVLTSDRTQVPGLSSHYYLGRKLDYASSTTLRAKTGFLVRPESLWFRHDYEPRELVDGLSANFEDEQGIGWQADKAFGRPFVGAHRQSGKQGRYLVQSSHKGTGTLRSAIFELKTAGLSALLGSSRGRGRLNVVHDGKTIFSRAIPRTRAGRMQRINLDLRQWTGKRIHLELVDDDAKGRVSMDDLRAI